MVLPLLLAFGVYCPVYVSDIDIPRVKMYRIAALAQYYVRFGHLRRNFWN